MSVLFGSGPDTDTEHRLQSEAESTLQGANANVPVQDFGGVMKDIGPEGRNAMLGSIAGYRDLINDPSGLGAAGRSAVLGGQNQAAQQSAATLRGLQEARERSGASSAGDTMAQEAAAAGGQADAANRAGLEGAMLGAQQKMAALGGNAAAGQAVQSGDISKAGLDLASKEMAQKALQAQFQNALEKAGAFSSQMGAYDKTKAGGGYGLLGNGLLSAQNIGSIAGAMTGGLGNLAGMIGGGLGNLFGGGDSFAQLGGEQMSGFERNPGADTYGFGYDPTGGGT